MTQKSAKELYRDISRVKNYKQFENILATYVFMEKDEPIELTLELEEVETIVIALKWADGRVEGTEHYKELHEKLHGLMPC